MGDRTLRACLIGLVLVSLLFVHLTEAAQPGWLLVLAILTLASPLLIPFRERFVYRSAWNLGVVGVFAILVHHATGDDLRYVLSDGLVLAALCQVHLLNNLRSDQRPDLMFLNSFLIALVTGFLSQDLTFALAFAAYVPLMIVGLCVYGLVSTGRSVSGEQRRRVVVDGLLRSAVLGAATLLVFVLWPRDFQRQGLLVAHLDLGGTGGEEVDFGESVALDKGGEAGASDEIVLRVSVESGSAADVPSLWRGATLMGTNGNRWWPFADGELGRGFAADEPWRGQQGGLARGAKEAQAVPIAARIAVEKLDTRFDRLFAPLSARRLWLGRGGQDVQVIANADATLAYGNDAGASPTVTYVLGLEAARGDELGGPILRSLPRDLRAYVDLPPVEAVRGAVDLAGELALETSGAEQHVVVDRFSEHLSRSYTYLPPGAEGAAEDLNGFLAGGAGHCEFFASALATMLRSRGIPCRLVTGYRSLEWDRDATVLTIRRRHAHAWVEVLDPQAGWYSVDPNPMPAEQTPTGVALWRRELLAAYTDLKADLQRAWEQLTAFDTERRAELMASARALVADGLRAAPGWLASNAQAVGAGALLLMALAAGLHRRRVRRIDPVVRDYRRALRAVRSAGVDPRTGETPRELLERAGTLALEPARLERLRAATLAHERARYA